MIESSPSPLVKPPLRSVTRLAAVLIVMASPFLTYFAAATLGQAAAGGGVHRKEALARDQRPAPGAIPTRGGVSGQPSALNLVPLPPSAPAEVTVQVFNGGAPAGSATRLSAALGSKGFSILRPRNALTRVPAPVSVYYRHNRFDALAVTAELGGSPVPGPAPPGLGSEAEVVVLLGSGYR